MDNCLMAEQVKLEGTTLREKEAMKHFTVREGTPFTQDFIGVHAHAPWGIHMEVRIIKPMKAFHNRRYFII